jgi:predicted HicB family RNase H-like nuclease
MKEKHRWPTTSIRVNPEALHQARVAAVTQKKTLGQWLEEAIVEKIERERKLKTEGQG